MKKLSNILDQVLSEGDYSKFEKFMKPSLVKWIVKQTPKKWASLYKELSKELYKGLVKGKKYETELALLKTLLTNTNANWAREAIEEGNRIRIGRIDELTSIQKELKNFLDSHKSGTIAVKFQGDNGSTEFVKISADVLKSWLKSIGIK